MRSFYYFTFFIVFFSSTKFSVFAVSLCKGLLDFLAAPLTLETFLTCLIILDNLQEVLGCSIVTDFMSIIFEFLKVFYS